MFYLWAILGNYWLGVKAVRSCVREVQVTGGTEGGMSAAAGTALAKGWGGETVTDAGNNPMRIYLDADACPVKEEVYRVAARYGVPVSVVANARLRIPSEPSVELVVVGGDIDAADDWIAEHATSADVVLTADVPLAARVMRSGATCLDFRGGEYNPNRIGDALASRDLNAYLRSLGLPASGPPAFQPRDRSRFASKLDAVVGRTARGRATHDTGRSP